VFLTVKGGQEAAEMAEVAKEKKLLNMVTTQGKVSVASAALDMGLTRDQVKNYVYDLVGKGLFTGYVNWDDGVLISQQASQMPRDKCPNCGGQLEGVVASTMRALDRELGKRARLGCFDLAADVLRRIAGMVDTGSRT
jgi:hypothetical protein